MKLLVVDGNSILNRAYYGVKPLTSHTGVPTNAVYGFFNILFSAIHDTKADETIVAFDEKEKTFRHKAVASYKANRKGMPDDLAVQLPYTKKILAAMGYRVITCAGWEADDILGTLSRICAESAADCVLLTGDRDNLQLIQDHVTVRLATNREPVLYDAEKFRTDYGFEPIHLIDLKALMGDSSDNISGVAGIGEKTAMALVQQFGDIENLYAKLPEAELKPAMRRKLEAGEADARQSKWLATIVTDAPIPQNLSDYAKQEQDTPALSALLTGLDLFKLMEKLKISPAAAASVPAQEEGRTAKAEAVTPDDAGFEALCNADFTVDFLLRPDALCGALLLAWGNKVTAVGGTEKILRFLSGTTPKRTFGAKPVYRYCMEHGVHLENLVLDAEICAYLLNPAVPEYAPDKLCAGYKITADAPDEYREIAVMPVLCETLEKEVREQDMESLLRDIEMPLIEVLADMEHTGVLIDADGVRDFGKKLSGEISQLQKEIYAQAGHAFNILSPKQLGTVLFEELALPTAKKTKTGYSTNADVLEGLRDKHPIIDLVLNYRQLTKLNSTYVDGLLAAVQPDGRIHTCYRQTETRTGRLSSTEPNLQNIPVRTELGREMRKFFVAPEGCVLLDADYSQIELRLVAHLCGDENMRNSFAEGRDIHRTTAAQVFDMPEEMVTKEMRSAAKAVNFGILYGISAFSLSKDIGVTVASADRYIKDYLHSFPKVEQFMEETVEGARKNGYVTTMFKRKRFVPELRASNKQVQAAGKRIAMNTPVQGTAADIIKAAMVRVWRRLRDEVPGAKLILQIHDELIVEAPLAVREKAAEILHTEMVQAVELSVPLTADVQEGASWYDAKG